MIGNRLFALAALGAVFAAAPAAAQFVGYRPANLWGGYDERELEPGVWRVSARLNALSGGGPTARAMANYRAAQVLKQRGFSHMRVLSQRGFSLGQTISDGRRITQRIGGGPGYAQLVVRGARGADDRDGCRDRRAERCVTVSVDAVMDSWRPYLDFGR